MAKPEWGGKHRCTHCGKAFYDLHRSPILCPACGKPHEPESPLKSRRGRAEDERAAAAARAELAAAVPVAEPEAVEAPVVADVVGDKDTEVVESLDDDKLVQSDDVIEDVTELGEDENDVAEVIEVQVEDLKE